MSPKRPKAHVSRGFRSKRYLLVLKLPSNKRNAHSDQARLHTPTELDEILHRDTVAPIIPEHDISLSETMTPEPEIGSEYDLTAYSPLSVQDLQHDSVITEKAQGQEISSAESNDLSMSRALTLHMMKPQTFMDLSSTV